MDFECISKKSVTSANTVLTLRIIRPSVRRGISEKRNQRTHPHRLTALRAAGHFVALSRWDVVNTRTLAEIPEIERALEKQMKGAFIYVWNRDPHSHRNLLHANYL
ncbi:hypothetical protein PASE110613_05800 [Paenibacillus sediminis]|uniref:Uncharacterized protein n=1 Tax=Paenibacillus sediminis TaxID=664909 RepID=A0ABS4H203_9BACL|nr:hypothetical protein [Paenibacillus sediminis]MBP1936292.1 hypothetical protein [Paenibacillus sediminis]